MLAPYIPDVSGEETGLEFVGKIVQSIVDSGHHRVYLESISLMTNANIDELLELDTSEALNMFVEGLQINKILDLKNFCIQVGIHG